PDGLPDGWLRYTLSWGDTNRSRWPVHPVWEAVQQAFQSLPDAGGLGPIVRKRVREVNVERGIAATAGYLSTLAAWYGEELACPESDLSLVLGWLYDVAHDYLDAKGQDFQALVRH